ADPDAAQAVGGGRQAPRQALPGVASVQRFEKTAGRAGVRVVVLPRTLPRGPEDCIDNLGVHRIERQIDGAGVLILVQNSLPGTPTIGRAKHAPLFVWTVWMTERCDKYTARVLGIDEDRSNLTCVLEPCVLPFVPSVDRLVDAIADREIGTLKPF